MRVILNQYQGLGDILFCEPIARYYKHKGASEIIWPVLSEFLWLKEYLPYINFVDRNHFNMDYESTYFGNIGPSTLYVPLRFANPIFRNLHPHDYSDQYHTMLDKYRMLNLPEDMWRNLAWTRNHTRENELYNRLIHNPNYILVNNKWSDGVLNIDVEHNTDSQIVYMDKIDGYTLLDWAYIIENASKIYTVSTSNLFLIETLSIKATDVYLYPRLPRENNFEGIMEFVNRDFKLVL